MTKHFASAQETEEPEVSTEEPKLEEEASEEQPVSNLCPASVSMLTGSLQPPEEVHESIPGDKEPSEEAEEAPAPAVEDKEVAEEQTESNEEPAAPPADEKPSDEPPPPPPPAAEDFTSAEEKEESKDTVGPIPGVVKSEAKTGEIHNPIPPDTPDFSAQQDLGESISHFISGSGIGVSKAGISEFGGDVSADTGRSLDMDTEREVGTGLTEGNGTQPDTAEEAVTPALEETESSKIEIQEVELKTVEPGAEESEKAVTPGETKEALDEAPAPAPADEVVPETVPVSEAAELSFIGLGETDAGDADLLEEALETKDVSTEEQTLQEDGMISGDKEVLEPVMDNADNALPEKGVETIGAGTGVEGSEVQANGEKEVDEALKGDQDFAQGSIRDIDGDKHDLLAVPVMVGESEAELKEGTEQPGVELGEKSLDVDGPSATETVAGKCAIFFEGTSSLPESSLPKQ